MMAKRLDARLRPHDGITVLDLKGEINSFGEHVLNDAYAQARSSGAGAILLNLKDVNYINSTGIALIVGLMADARKTGTRLVASGLSDHYLEIFRITRLADFMEIFPDEETALSDFHSQLVPAKMS